MVQELHVVLSGQVSKMSNIYPVKAYLDYTYIILILKLTIIFIVNEARPEMPAMEQEMPAMEPAKYPCNE